MLDYYDYDYDADSDEYWDEEAVRIWHDDDPLVRRLRTMKWTEAPAGVRERCWMEIEKRIDALEHRGLLPGSRPVVEVNCERYGFSRRPELCDGSAGRGRAGWAAQSLGRGLAFAAR